MPELIHSSTRLLLIGDKQIKHHIILGASTTLGSQILRTSTTLGTSRSSTTLGNQMLGTSTSQISRTSTTLGSQILRTSTILGSQILEINTTLGSRILGTSTLGSQEKQMKPHARESNERFLLLRSLRDFCPHRTILTKHAHL